MRILKQRATVLPHLEAMRPEDILEKSDKIEKINRVARLNYGLGDSAIGGSLSINVLTNQAAVVISQN